MAKWKGRKVIIHKGKRDGLCFNHRSKRKCVNKRTYYSKHFEP